MLAGTEDRGIEVRKFDGATFGAAVPLSAAGDDAQQHLYQDAAGRLHAVFPRGEADGLHLIHATSDDGATWASGTLLVQSDGGIADTRAAVAPDHLGVAVWSTRIVGGPDAGYQIRVAPIGPVAPVDPPPPPPGPTADGDGDGVADGADNCPAEANGDQRDVDGDRIGDACERFPLPGRPLAGKTSTLRVTSGTVRVFVAGSGFVPLTGAANLPLGAIIDARRGKLAVTTAADFRAARAASHKTSTAQVAAGIFQIKQQRAAAKAAVTDLRLRTRAGAARACAAGRKPPAKGVVRALSGRAKGRYRLTGKAAVAKLTNATWAVEDRCNGTRMKVKRGKLAVFDRGRRRTVTVRAGKSYLAKARLFGAKAAAASPAAPRRPGRRGRGAPRRAAPAGPWR